jgi:hypothetical protein
MLFADAMKGLRRKERSYMHIVGIINSLVGILTVTGDEPCKTKAVSHMNTKQLSCIKLDTSIIFEQDTLSLCPCERLPL